MRYDGCSDRLQLGTNFEMVIITRRIVEVNTKTLDVAGSREMDFEMLIPMEITLVIKTILKCIANSL